MAQFLLSTALTLLAFAQQCWAGVTPSTPEDEIRQVVARYMTARNRQDLAALQALFTPDADQLVSTGVWRRGLDELLKGAMASSKKENGQSSVTLESVRLLGPDTAIADGRYETSASGAQTVRKMWSTFVLRRTGNEWRIAAIRNMLPAEH
jgi:uncharacterized protein (TIGR02246 family)